MYSNRQRPISIPSLPILIATVLLVAGLFILPVGRTLADSTYQTLPFSQDWSNTGMITTNDDWSGVPGIIGYRGDGLTSFTGVDPQTILEDGTSTPVDVNANQTNPNTFTTGGVTEFQLADPVVALTGSGTADAPFLLVSINTTQLRNIRVGYNVRDLETGTDNAIQQVALHYRVGNTGGFTNLPDGYIADATIISATMVTPISVTLPAAANNQPLVQLRLMTTNAVGNDESVGIDDIIITGEPPGFIITKDAPAIVSPGEAFTYTITVQNRLGYTLTNVTVVDNLPANVSSGEGDTVVRSLATLADGTEIDFSFPVTATDQVTVVLNSSYYVTATEFITPTYGEVATTFVVSGSLQIHDIQGPGHVSPFVGQTLENIRGVVTMLTTSGFYMQDDTPDTDPYTSEGIYVYSGSAPSVLVGADISLSGLVAEYNGMTELTSVSNLVQHGTGLTIVPTPVSLPVPPGEDLEPYESMLVVFPQILTVSQNYFQGRYGQVTLSAGRMYNPTNGNGLGDTVEYNLRRTIVLDDASTLQNPNPIPYIGDDNTLRAGDEVSGVTGVVDYGLITSESSTRFYRLQPTMNTTFTRVNERTTAPEEIGGSLKVASLNVLNYFNGDGLGGGFPTSRGATTYEEFVRQRTKIITATVSLGADIVGLMEIENDGDDSLSAIQDLVNGLNEVTGTGTYTFTAEPEPGSDQIKVAMVYRPDVVTPVGEAMNYQVYDHPIYQPLYDRPPLVQLFSVNATGQTFYVIVNHFKSKSSCPTSLTDPDSDYGQGCWNVKRVAQAEGLLDLIAELKATSSEPDALIIGDLNAYGEEDPILALTDGGIVNELSTRVPDEDRYSYVFDGQSGYLDQALATASLDEQISDATIWHINADEPSVIDYNTEFKPQDLYTPTPYRSSDHDPVLVGLDLRPAALSIIKTVTFANDPPAPGEWITYTVVVSNAGPSTAWNVHVTDILPGSVIGADVNVTVTIPAENSFEAVIPAMLAPDYVSYGTTITNTASYSCSGVGSGMAMIAFDVAGAPVLVVEKSVELVHEPTQPGDPITYTITISNQGESDAIDVHIVDMLPAEVIGAGVDVTVTIAGGSTYAIVIPTTLSSNAEFGAIVTNTVYVYHSSGDISTSAVFQIVAWMRIRLPLIYRAP